MTPRPTPTQALRPRIGARSIVAILSAMVLGLAGCTYMPSQSVTLLRNAQSDLPAEWRQSDAENAGALADLSQWWLEFNDPVLTSLTGQALQANTDLAAAIGRLRSARAAVKAARGALLPSLSTSASASRNEPVNGGGRGSSFFDVGIDASWEADLFGSLGGSAAAASATYQGSRATLYDVQRSITAEVALTYLDLRNAQARLMIAEENLSIQRDNRQIADWLFQAGLTDALDLEQARTLVAQTEANLPPLRQTIDNDINQMDILLGQVPGTSTPVLTPVRPVPAAPAVIGTGLPAQLLERRPDIIAAQHTLEANIIRIGVARADLYPALRLSGSIRSSAPQFSNLLDTTISNLVANLTAPIFQGGRIRAQIEQQKGAADASLASYRRTVLVALQEVENALVAIRTAREREEALARAEVSARESVKLAEIRYRSGEISFQQLLDAQRSLLGAQDSRQSAVAARSIAAVSLFKALGGGWPANELALQEAQQ